MLNEGAMQCQRTATGNIFVMVPASAKMTAAMETTAVTETAVVNDTTLVDINYYKT